MVILLELRSATFRCWQSIRTHLRPEHGPRVMEGSGLLESRLAHHGLLERSSPHGLHPQNPCRIHVEELLEWRVECGEQQLLLVQWCDVRLLAEESSKPR